MVSATTHRILRNDDRFQIKNLLRIGNDFHRAMDRIFDTAVEHGAYDIVENMELLQRDTNLLAYSQALMMNIDDEQSDLQLLSTLKMLAKSKRISDRIIDRIKEPLKEL